MRQKRIPQRIASRVISWLIVLVACMSCAPDLLYNEFRVIPTEGWTANTHCLYEVEMKAAKQPYHMQVNVRHTGNYPYQELWLIVDRTAPDGVMVSDTIEAILADSSGRWLGKGSGLVYLKSVLSLPWKVDLTGKYSYKIRHAMSDTNLQGVSAVGLNISLQNGKK